MEKDIVDGKIGEAGAYDVEFKGGKLQSKIDLNLAPVAGVVITGTLLVAIEAAVVLDALKAAIPGHFDDVLLDGAKALLAG